jgi:integrase
MATIVARKRADGTTAYTAQIRIKRGGAVIHSESRTFTKKAMAKAWAAEREDCIKRDPASAARRTHAEVTIRHIIAQYIARRSEVEPLGRSKLSHLRLLQTFDLTETPALELTAPRLIAHIQARRAAGAGPSTVKNDVVWLRVVLKWARTALGIPVDIGPIDDAAQSCQSERLIGHAQRRRRRPTDDELRRITDWFRVKSARRNTPPMALLMWFAIYSCRRLDEICRMRLRDYDREHGVWLIRDLKHPSGSKGHDLEMRVTPQLAALVEVAIRDVPRTDDRLFPFNSRTIGTYWQRQLKVLGIEDLHFHDLRHEGCSRLAEDGLTIPEIQAVSLHESWGSLQIYVNTRARKSQRVEWADWSD